MLSIKTDSRKVVKGDTFVAISGINHDGHNYIQEAIDNGAVNIIVEKKEYEQADVTYVKSTRKYLETYLDTKYQETISKLKIIAVTGTNGKTTTCHFVQNILENRDIKCATIGTLGFFCGTYHLPLVNTTPDILTLYECLLTAYNEGCTVVIMEVTSIALEQRRIGKLKFDIIGYTNITLDHLDYHHTMEDYIAAKKQILNHQKDRTIIIYNKDDKYHHHFVSNNSISYGNCTSDMQILRICNHENKIQVLFLYGHRYLVDIDIVGSYNVYNYILALLICLQIDSHSVAVIEESKKITLPKGRSQRIVLNKGSAVIDFAHTPDAIKKVLLSFKETTKSRIITIVGCGGCRDSQKRPIIGIIATKYSDYVIFTNDNPRNEDPMTIINDMTALLTNTNYEVITDRKKAIFQGCSMLEKSDVLLVLGKGHESIQIINDQHIPYSDYDSIKEFIKLQ